MRPVSQPSLQTAEIIAKALEIKLKKIERLQNLNQGLWQGMLVEDVRHKQPKVYRQWQEQPENVCPPEGEMLSEADDRVRDGAGEAAETSQGRGDRAGRARAAVEPGAPLHHHGELGDLWKAPNGHGRFEVLAVDPEEVLAASV